ncbi:uncharacterized protein LOC142590002 isoform X2 [Dermacentor variabilis]|uniref:uncharacterized protein LOC142590002 isoform X2 n=1 Tax=Dermacentor variabilis TaxID=34621 RepID=UPI003F5B9508
MGGSGSRAASTADRPVPPPPQQQQPACSDALALSSAPRSGPLLVPRYAMFIRRAWSRLRKAPASTATAPYASPADVRDAGVQQSTSPSTTAEDKGKAAGGGPSARATSLMGVVMSSAAEERIRWRRNGRDRRRSWGFRKLKTRSDSAMSSPEGPASPKAPPNVAADVAGALAEGSPRSPSANKPGLTPAGTLDPSTVTNATAGADDYACLAEDDINWSTGYVKLCYMPDALNQECSSFQDLRKGLDEYPATTVQSQVVVERLQSVEQRVNLRDGRSVFSETTERICYGRKTARVVSEGDTSEEQACELMTFDADGSMTTAVLQRSVVVQQKRSRTECPGWQTSTPDITDEERTVLAVPQQQVQTTSTTTPGVTPEPIETRRCGSLSPTGPVVGNYCPVGLLIQPHQQYQQQRRRCWGNGISSDDNGRGGAAVQRRDSVFDSGSFLYALRHSPPANFPPPHPPATSEQQRQQQFWCGDRGSLENYAARGDFSGQAGTWHNRHRRRHQVPRAERCSGSAPSSEDDGSAFARRTSASSRQRSGTAAAKASFDDGEVADIFMFSDDDDDLCAEDLCATDSDHDRPVVAPPMRPGNNNHHFEVNLGSREMAAAAGGQRNVEDGSGDNSSRMIELAVRI